MEKSAKSQGSGGAVVVVLVVLVVVGYVAYRYKMIPKSWLAAVGLGGAAGGAAESAAGGEAGGPVGTSQLDYTEVGGSVIFEGAPPAAARKSCASEYMSSKASEKVRKEAETKWEGLDFCKAKVDPCKLVGKTLDAAPKCHTVASLCKQTKKKGVESSIVPWPNKRICTLQERGALDHAGIDKMKGVQIPEGIQLDVNKSAKCSASSEFSKVCTASQGCSWTSPDYYADVGMQFSVAPGYKLTCGKTTHYGDAKSS